MTQPPLPKRSETPVELPAEDQAVIHPQPAMRERERERVIYQQKQQTTNNKQQTPTSDTNEAQQSDKL